MTQPPKEDSAPVHGEADINVMLQTARKRDEETFETYHMHHTVDFEEGDRRNPVNFSPARKWAITINACALRHSAAASSICTRAPLVTSSFSEEFGRVPFYIVSSFMFVLTEVMIALISQGSECTNRIVARAIGGCFGSTGATLVAGTTCRHMAASSVRRGFPMSLYAFAVIASSGLGPMIAGWIEANSSLEWRWIQWIHAIVSGVYSISTLLIMRETRSTVILARMARQVRKDTGDGRYRARSEENKPLLMSMIATSCTRSLSLLSTEPIVQSFSLWIGFVWDSVSSEFKNIYGFGVGRDRELCNCDRLSIGSLLGYLANVYQKDYTTQTDHRFRKYVHRKGQEARLYIACVASITLPTGMFIFAWTARADIPWIVSLIGLTLFMTSAFIIYQVVFIYLADCYGPYASSALAGQSMCRDYRLPALYDQMNDLLTYKWAGTVFALIAAIMIPIPYILFFYGSRIRRRSPVSQKILEIEAEQRNPSLEKS
ncbi:major facilitator superfamily domain-containing protein [Suillus lakei]|nr:major facilitator superfamily domain-containing protein [Suillus lakei]